MQPPAGATASSPQAPTATPATRTPEPPDTPEAVTFATTFGGERRDRGIHLLQTQDGGYAVVGYSSSPGAASEDVYLVRTDSHGEMIWSRTYGGPGIDNGWDLIETEDGSFLITGFTDSTGAGLMDIYLLRTDRDGNLLWERTYGGPGDEYGWAMTATTDGNYVLAGQTTSFGAGLEDGFLVKVSPEGDQLWSQTFGGEAEDRLFSIDRSADGGFILTGTTRSFGPGSRNLYLVKTNSAGEQDWMQVFGEDRDDVGHAVRQTHDQGFIVTGYTKSFEASDYDSWLVKTDETGALQWQALFGGPGDDRTIYGEPTADGGFVLTGYTRNFGARGWDVFLVKTGADGQVEWHKNFGGVADDTGYTVKQAADGGFVLAGETYSLGAGGGDLYLIKVDQEGEVPGLAAPTQP
ncbi:MAG: hypothetical protein R3335_02275 [Anaerolineales bacterium]|nr:hypothetical protein [Anaerolineales bacterium]